MFLIDLLKYILFITLGACIGSFFANLLFRSHRNESIFKVARSHCDHCNHVLNWYENIPILSFVLLKGKCTICGKDISAVYFIFEILSAINFVSIFLLFQNQVLSNNSYYLIFPFIISLIFEFLLYFSFYDILFLEINDTVALVFIIFLFLLNIFLYFLGIKILTLGNINNLIAGIVGAMLFIFIITVSRGKMGGGEIRYGVIIGLLVGFGGLYVTITTASLVGILYFVFWKLLMNLLHYKNINLQREIPFLPFLTIGIIISIFFGEFILSKLFGF